MSFVWGEVPVGIFAFLLIGLCASVMWGGIFNLATEGLGKYTAKASGAFMMMVAGFAVMIWLQAAVVDFTHNYITSFIVVLLSAAYIFYFAFWGSKRSEETRLNSSHTVISYAVFCLKKKKNKKTKTTQPIY